MTNAELIRRLSTELDCSLKEARHLLRHGTALIRAELDAGRSVHLPGFGTFSTRVRPERRWYDPFRRHLAWLPKKVNIVFKGAKALRERFADPDALPPESTETHG